MKTINLHADRAAVRSVPIPDQTNTYKPIKNGDIIDCVFDLTKQYGLNMINENYKATNNLGQVIGTYTFDSGDDSGINCQLAVRNSYDKSRSFLAIGSSEVFICTNGMYTGDFQYSHKHIGDVQENFELQIKYVFDKMYEQHQLHLKASRRFSEIPADREFVAKVIGNIFSNNMYEEDDIFKIHEFSIFTQQLKRSTTHKTIDNPEFSAWDLFNHGTYALKGSHPSTAIEQHLNWYNLIDDISKGKIITTTEVYDDDGFVLV